MHGHDVEASPRLQVDLCVQEQLTPCNSTVSILATINVSSWIDIQPQLVIPVGKLYHPAF